MTFITEQRRRLFRAALAISNMTQEEWAKKHGQVTPQHLSLWLCAKRESAVLDKKADQFITKTRVLGEKRYGAFTEGKEKTRPSA